LKIAGEIAQEKNCLVLTLYQTMGNQQDKAYCIYIFILYPVKIFIQVDLHCEKINLRKNTYIDNYFSNY